MSNSKVDGWGDLRVGERFPGGIRNDVRRACLDGRDVAVRRGTRAGADLEWELDLLDDLAVAGFEAPQVIPTRDGRRHVDGLVVMELVGGRPPTTVDDWRATARYLAALHEFGHGRPQRPGWGASTDLLHRSQLGFVDLDVLPSEAVAPCRAAWARLAGRQMTVVHGDPNDRNIRILDDGRVAMLDWDEARVDVPDLDLAALPTDVNPLTGEARWVAHQAVSAWEAASCWTAETDYARRRLAEVSGNASC